MVHDAIALLTENCNEKALFTKGDIVWAWVKEVVMDFLFVQEIVLCELSNFESRNF